MSSRVIIGKHAVKATLTSGQHIEKVYIRGHHTPRDIQHIIALSKEERIQLQWLEPKKFDQRFSGDHQGIACITHSFSQASLTEIIHKKPRVILMLDHIQDPHNFGAICRTAEAFGIHHICYPKNRAVQLTPSVEKAATGAINNLTFCKLTNLNQALKQLSAHGYWVYAASSNIGQPIHTATFNDPMVIICGSEHHGVSPGLKKSIDEWIHIPLIGKTSSLNVSVATGIIIHTIASTK